MYHQHWLEDGTMKTVAWLDGLYDVGTRISTKAEPDRIWTIVGASSRGLEKPPRQDWNVGGLNEPRR